MYSTLAGFIEAGENAEEALIMINASSAFSPASIKPARVLYILAGKNLLLPNNI